MESKARQLTECERAQKVIDSLQPKFDHNNLGIIASFEVIVSPDSSSTIIFTFDMAFQEKNKSKGGGSLNLAAWIINCHICPEFGIEGILQTEERPANDCTEENTIIVNPKIKIKIIFNVPGINIKAIKIK